MSVATVAYPLRSSNAIGGPTLLESPSTTAFHAVDWYFRLTKHGDNTRGNAGTQSWTLGG